MDANRQMERCSTSLVIREMQIKSTVLCHLSSVRMAVVNKSTSVVQDVEKESRLVRSLRKTVWSVLRKLKVEPPYDPVIPLLGIYSKKPKTPIQKDTHTYVHCSISYNSQAMEAAQGPISWWVDKKVVVRTYNGTLLSHKKRTLTICNSIDGPREYYAKWSKSEKDKCHKISHKCGI